MKKKEEEEEKKKIRLGALQEGQYLSLKLSWHAADSQRPGSGMTLNATSFSSVQFSYNEA